MSNQAERFMVESLLLTVTKITTKLQSTILSNATGFFFERDDKLFLITNRHVVINEDTNHYPDVITMELHVTETNVAQVKELEIPLYTGEKRNWRETADLAGVVDVISLELDRRQFPPSTVYHAFNTDKLVVELDEVEVGTPLLVVGFPLGFHDTLHHLPVARQAIIASAFGLRFQGTGCFLTDGRTHRGISGAPVVARFSNRRGRSALPFMLLGIHASRIDMTTRDAQQDEALGVNCAWYADILLPLTGPEIEITPEPQAAVDDH